MTCHKSVHKGSEKWAPSCLCLRQAMAAVSLEQIISNIKVAIGRKAGSGQPAMTFSFCFTWSILKYWYWIQILTASPALRSAWCSPSGCKGKRRQINSKWTRTKKKHDHTLVSSVFVVLSISARSCVPRRELKMVFGRQTTSFRRASVISCGISGLDVPPQISRPSREACGSRQAAFPIIVLNC